MEHTKACQSETHTTPHNNSSRYQTRITKKCKKSTEGKVMKVVPVNTITLIVVIEGIKLPRGKKLRLILEKSINY